MRAFSAGEANCYMYELAQARKLLIVGVAASIVGGGWVWSEVSQELSLPMRASDWVGGESQA